jgi:uncharacterized membrane protein
MTSILIALSIWLHNMGTLILIGHYFLLSILYIPALKNENRILLSEISKRSRAWLYLALLIFALTGSYLTLVDPNYLGFANFGNVWGVLMLVKHLIIAGMIGLGFWFNAILRVGPMMRSNSGGEQAAQRFALYANLMAIAGVLVLLLTAIAQIE